MRYMLRVVLLMLIRPFCLDTDVDFADVTNPSVFCNDDNSSVFV